MPGAPNRGPAGVPFPCWGSSRTTACWSGSRTDGGVRRTPAGVAFPDRGPVRRYAHRSWPELVIAIRGTS